MIFLLQQMLFFSMPLLVVAVGGLYSEKSGIVNIALEGLMIFGAFCGILFLFFMEGRMDGQLTLVIALLIATSGGMLLGLMHAYASVSMKANQAISGMALNIIAPAMAVFIAREVTPSELIPFRQRFQIRSIPVLSEIPFIGPVLFERAYITTYVALVVFLISIVVILKTRFGLRLRASGEHPHALDAAGVNVKKVRYASVLISGALAGLGGMVFFIPTAVEFSAEVSGYGFLAIAVLVFSKWNIKRIILISFFFGLMQTIGAAYGSLIFFRDIDWIAGEFYKMLPYVATLVVLAFSKGASPAPSAIGVPYDVSDR